MVIVKSKYFKGLNYWNNLIGFKGGKVIYVGEEYQKRSHGFEVILLTLVDEKLNT